MSQPRKHAPTLGQGRKPPAHRSRQHSHITALRGAGNTALPVQQQGPLCSGLQLLYRSKQGPCQHIPARCPARPLLPAPPTHPLGTPTTREGWISPWQQPPACNPSLACRATTQSGK